MNVTVNASDSMEVTGVSDSDEVAESVTDSTGIGSSGRGAFSIVMTGVGSITATVLVVDVGGACTATGALDSAGTATGIGIGVGGGVGRGDLYHDDAHVSRIQRWS